MKSNFDQVGVQVAGGGYNLLSREQFLKLPVTERIHLILNGKVQFIRDGQIIPVMEALGSAAPPAANPRG